MAVKSESDHVDQDVLFIFVPVADHEFGAANDSLRVTRIHAKNWHTEGLNDVGRLFKAAIIGGVCSESNLVVCDYVDRAIALKLGKLAECEGFVRRSLSWESSIAVALDVHHSGIGFAL